MHLKQNTQFEASKKGMFDKMGVEAVENLHPKKRVILNRVAPDSVGRFFFCVFRIAGRYNLQINSKPFGLIEKLCSICKNMIYIRINEYSLLR